MKFVPKMNSFKRNNLMKSEEINKNINTEIKENDINRKNKIQFQKFNSINTLKNYKTDINDLPDQNNLNTKTKAHRKKNIYKTFRKKHSFSLMPNKNSNIIYESLIHIKQNNIPINDIKNNNCDGDNKQNMTFSIDAKIKQKLLKDYKSEQKFEKKYRNLNLTKKVYDSLEDNEESSDENENSGMQLHISSESNFIFIFDFLLIFCSFYTLFFFPLSLARRKYFCQKEKTLSMIPKILTEVMFLLDFLISFIRSYYNYEYKKIILTRKIIKHYLRQGFFLDFIEAIPSYIIPIYLCNNRIKDNRINEISLSNKEIYLSVLLIVKSFKIYKVLRNKNNRAVELLYEYISEYYYLEQFINFLKYFIIVFSFFHTLICIHVFLGVHSYPNWMTSKNIFNNSLGNKYITSFYFIITTMTTVGYGDIVCVSSKERNFQIILLGIGTIIYSFIITKFGNYIGKKNDIQIELSNKENILEQIRISYPLMPFNLYYKIHNYLKKKAKKKENNRNIEIFTLVNSLPEKFKKEILNVIYKDVINDFKFFNDCKNSDFIIKVLSSFVQTICKKDTILLLEGKKIESIIFVKDGRLILEATIDSLDPFKSVEKYFKVNFADIDINQYNNKRNSLTATKFGGADIERELEELKEENEEKNITFLKERLNHFFENNNKYNNNNKNQILELDNTNNSISLGGINNKSSDEEEGSIQNKNLENCHFLKILDVRKNEYFGEVYMFLDKPCPLTLKVKSKRAEIFAIKKKDALYIKKVHYNIMNRIQIKSYKNLISIKKKTLRIVKKFCETNKIKNAKGIPLQDISWIRDKSRNSIFLSNISNLTGLTRIKDNKENNNMQNFNLKRSKFKYSCFNEKVKRAISKIKNDKIRKSITNNSIENIDKNLINNILGFNSKKFSEKSLIVNKLPLLNKIISKKEEKSPSNDKTMEKDIRSSINSLKNFMTTQDISKKFNSQSSLKIANTNNNDLSSFSKSSPKKILKNKIINKSIASPEIIEEETQVMSLIEINSYMDRRIRKRIKARVKKEKILKLLKLQNKIYNLDLTELNNEKINNYIDEMNIIDETIQNIINIKDIKNNKDLNNLIYNQIMEYLSTDDESENEENKTQNNFETNNLIEDKIISFDIKSSYDNLNVLTDGKIMKNENLKNKIKLTIKKYKQKKKERISKNQTIKIRGNFNGKEKKKNFFLNNANTLAPEISKNINLNISEISSISSIQVDQSDNRLNTFLTEKKRSNINFKNSKRQKTQNIYNSNQIKKSINNQNGKIKNYKSLKIDNKIFRNKLYDNGSKKDFSLNELLNKDSKIENKSISSAALINQDNNKNENNNNKLFSYVEKYK